MYAKNIFNYWRQLARTLCSSWLIRLQSYCHEIEKSWIVIEELEYFKVKNFFKSQVKMKYKNSRGRWLARHPFARMKDLKRRRTRERDSKALHSIQGCQRQDCFTLLSYLWICDGRHIPVLCWFRIQSLVSMLLHDWPFRARQSLKAWCHNFIPYPIPDIYFRSEMS